MKLLKVFVIIILASTILSCKDECPNYDCPASPQGFYLKILPLDSNNRSPYLDPNKFLHADSLEIINLTNKEIVSSSFQDSLIILQGSISINSIEISYSKSISDIVTIEKKTTDPKCCPKFISSVNYVFRDTTFICGTCNSIVRYIQN